MREMRLHKREITDPAVLKEILEECDVVRIGMTDAEGMFIMPLNYGYEFQETEQGKKLTFYFHGSAEGRKADAIRENSKAAFEMDCRHSVIKGEYTCSYSFSYRSIMGDGNIHELKTDEEKKYGLEKVMEHMAPEAKIEFLPEMLARTTVWKLEAERFTGKERKQKA